MNFNGQRICDVPDQLGGLACFWPFSRVSVYAEGMLGQVRLPEAVEEAITGVGSWNECSGIELFMTTNRKTSNINITKGDIDGGFGTLAWSELPCGFTPQNFRQILQKYDEYEVWVVAENPPNNKIDAVRVIRHEIGHAIGISHIPQGLMAPTYSSRIRGVQVDDIKEARSRYGMPALPVPPTSTTQEYPTTTTMAPWPPANPPTVPTLPPDIFNRLFPCIGTWLLTFTETMTPEERKKFARLVVSTFKMLTPEDIEFLQKMQLRLNQEEREVLHQLYKEVERIEG